MLHTQRADGDVHCGSVYGLHPHANRHVLQRVVPHCRPVGARTGVLLLRIVTGFVGTNLANYGTDINCIILFYYIVVPGRFFSTKV